MVLAADMEERQVSRESSLAKMLTTWQAMVDASDSYTGDRRSVSGLVGGRRSEKCASTPSGARPCPAATSVRSSQRPSAWRSPTPVCAASWRPPRQEPAAYCRQCCCPCASMRAEPAPDSEALYVASGIGAVIATGPVSPAPPAAVKRRSAPPAPWRRGLWWPSGAAAASRSATPWPWP